MNRRQFSATTGGLLASLLLPKFERVRKIDLSLFCDDITSRYDLKQPFLQEGKVYATDGRIALQVMDAMEELAGEDARLPGMGKLNWGDRNSTGWTPIGKLLRAEREDCNCETCYGRGQVGTHVHECECYDYHEGCTHNLGYVGGVECPECQGGGLVDYCYELDGEHFSPSFIGKLKTIEAVEVKPLGGHPAPNTSRYDDHTCLVARFPQGNGLLMGLQK